MPTGSGCQPGPQPPPSCLCACPLQACTLSYACCCWPCMLCQELNTIEREGLEPGGGDSLQQHGGVVVVQAPSQGDGGQTRAPEQVQMFDNPQAAARPRPPPPRRAK